MSSIAIVLENYPGYYHPGDTIKGHLTFTLSRTSKITSVEVTILGEAKTLWTKCFPRFVTFYAHRILLSDIISSTQVDRTLQSGNHKYTFAYQLSSTLPPSFDSKYGLVSYVLQGQVRTSPFKMDLRCTLKLNLLSKLIPVDTKVDNKVVMDRTVQLFRSYPDKITVHFEASKSSLQPGEVVLVEVTVANQTRYIIECVKVSLVQTVTYQAFVPEDASKLGRMEVCSQKSGKIDPRCVEHWMARLVVPQSYRAQDLSLSEVMEMRHSIEVTVCFPGCIPNVRLLLPIDGRYLDCLKSNCT